MGTEPKSFNLFWVILPGEGTGPDLRTVTTGLAPAFVPVGRNVKLVRPPPIEAIILYPALLTPAVVSHDVQNSFEVLLLAPSDPVFNAELVNRHLKISPGLDARKWATRRPLFETKPTAAEIDIQKLDTPRDGTLATESLFRGIVDERFWDAFDAWQKKRAKEPATKGRPKLDTLYRVRIAGSCIEKAAGPTAEDIDKVIKETGSPPEGTWPNFEPQDDLVLSILLRMNGPDLRGQNGRGTSCFALNEQQNREKVHLARANLEEPIRAYHPVFVYETLGFANIGHIADLHINSRQNYMARSPARVVDASGDGDDGATRLIKDWVNIYSDNALSILGEMCRNAGDRPEIDVLLVGGDVIDHVRNVYPHGLVSEDRLSAPTSAATIWRLLDPRGDNACYQEFVDHLTFYSVMQHFCATRKRPAFLVSGNHDAYIAPYGISPRKVGFLMNEGIPADHNLTFYEAILLFGEGFGEVDLWKGRKLHTELLQWFYGVFTPFRDYAVDLPKQRIVGLAWGDDEKKVFPGGEADDQPESKLGVGFLPRADQAVLDPQLELFREAVSDRSKKVILSTHFTFVSYKNELPNDPAPRHGSVGSDSYARNDWGTFQEKRPELYEEIHGAAGRGGSRIQCVFTGHSHRKGLYYVTGGETKAHVVNKTSIVERVFPTLMYPLHDPAAVAGALRDHAALTPIVVSDSAGPLPRMNAHDEFGSWGSDRPAGTVVGFSADGILDCVVPVASTLSRATPRAVVAIDYLHVYEKRGLVSIKTDPHDWQLPAEEREHFLYFTFHKRFPPSVRLMRGTIHVKPTRALPWNRIPFDQPSEVVAKDGSKVVTLTVASQHAPELWRFLVRGGAPRFISLHFQPEDALVAERYDFRDGWSFEVDCKPGRGVLFAFELVPNVEIPNFDIRRQFFPETYR
jgi:hypothetical protein